MVVTNNKCFDSETFHEGENKILRISAEACPFPPSIEYSDICMSKVIDLLLQNTGVTIIIIAQQREYEYDHSQTKLLVEVARTYRQLNQEDRSHHEIVADPQHERYIRGAHAEFQRIVSKQLKEDPMAAYVLLKRLEIREKVKLNHIAEDRHLESQKLFIQHLQKVIKVIEQMKIIQMLLPYSNNYELGQREIYGNVFRPTTKPDFMFTKLITEFPDGNLEESYDFKAGQDNCQINIFSFDDNIKTLYHITPPEFTFEEELYGLLDDAKRIMSEHKPSRKEFVDPERMREVFFNIGKDLLNDLIKQKGLNIKDEKVSQLAQALLRYTVGFGLI
jgi:hypothetical protein